MKTNKMVYKVLSVLMAAMMLFGVAAPAIGAIDLTPAAQNTEEKETIKYVSIGDSMTNGYGFTGYNQDKHTAEAGKHVDPSVYNFFDGTGVYGEGSYANQFAKYLADEGYDVTHTKLATSAFRVEDLVVLLGLVENPLDATVLPLKDGYFNNSWAYVWNWCDEMSNTTHGWDGYGTGNSCGLRGYHSWFLDEVVDEENNYSFRYPEGEAYWRQFQSLSNHYQTSLKEANIISLALGNASFDAYVMDRLFKIWGALGDSFANYQHLITLDEIKEQLCETPAEEAFVDKIYETMTTVAADMLDADDYSAMKVDSVCQLMTYVVFSYMYNYKQVIEWIGKENPDAKIMIVGILNSYYGLSMSGIGDEPLDMGDSMGALYDMMNTYVAGMCADYMANNDAFTGKILFVEQPDEPEMIAKVIPELAASGWGTIDNGRLDGAIVRYKTVEAYNDCLVPGFYATGIAGTSSMNPDAPIGDCNAGITARVEEMLVAKPDATIKDLMVATGWERRWIGGSLAYLGCEAAMVESLNESTIELDAIIEFSDNEAMMETLAGAPKSPLNENAKMADLIAEYKNFFETNMMGVIRFFAFNKMGNGIAAHPTPSNHDRLAANMIAAYENGYTVQDKCEDNPAPIIANEIFTALVLDEEKQYLTIDQTMDIVDFVMDRITDGISNEDIREIAKFIWFDVFGTEPVALYANSGDEPEVVYMDPSDKLAVIEIVYGVLAEKNLMTAPELEDVEELYVALKNEESVSDAELVKVMDIVFGTVIEKDALGEEGVASVTTEITQKIMNSNISPEAKMTIVEKVTDALANSNLGNVAGIPDLSVINALRDALKDYVTDAEAAKIIGAVTTVLLGGDVDYVEIVDVVYANLLGDHTAEEKIAIIGIIYTVLDEYGYIELGVINAYIYAYNLAAQKGYIDTAIDGIDAAIAGIENAIEFVESFETEDVAIREKMVEELEATIVTLEQLKADLAEGKFATLEGSINTVFEYKDELHAHRDALTVLAKAIGAEIDPYITDFVETVDFYANMVNDIVVDAYNFAVATNDAFVKGYKDFTATAVKYATMIDPELGAAVEKFLTETPADAMAIVHRYGKDSLLKLVVDAAAASDKIEVKALALVQILIEHGETIYNAVVDAPEFDALVDRLEETKAELIKLYEEYEKAPVATALKYEEQIAILEKELYDLGSKLYDLIIAASETVDPEIAEMLDASVNALLESLDIVDTAVDGYLTYLDGAVKAMAGDLLASLLENATELGDTAWNVLMKLLHKLNDFLYAYVNDLMEELSDVYEVLNAACIKLLGMTLEEVQAKVDAALKGEYTVTDDSYLAVIGGSYGDRLADALGLTNKYTGMTWDAIDLDELAKADFVVLGYDQAQINGFAADQLAATLGEYLDTVIRETANEYADRVINEYFDDPSKVEALTAEIDALIDGLLASELFAGKTVETMDWADLIGAENVQYVDEVRDGLYALLAKKGITNDFTYTLDLATYIADAVSLKVEKVYEMLGDDAYITIEIPAADFAVLAVESYLYSNAVFQKTYSETILALNEQNPDVTIAVLGQYNPFVNFEELPLADIYEVVAALASAHSFGYAVAMPNVTYVDISAAYKAEETDLMSFILEYLGNADALALDEAGEQYVLDQILNAYGLACQHVYDDECTDTDCNACGALREAPGHDYVAVVTDPTCTEGGYTTYTCSKCGDTYVADEVEALGHKWVDATCTEPKTCSVCGETEGEALGHKWVDATCTEPKTCDLCGETEGEALGHTWVDATCTEPKTCSVCGETEGEALGHTWVDATCTTPKTCSVCGETEGEALGHKWVDATCTTPKTCSVCGETEGEALGHKWVDATCTEPKTCSVCGETEGEALGHTYDNACDADCNVCGATRTPAEHQFGDWTVVVEATEEAEGKEERKCSVCGHVESRVIPMLEKTGLSTGAVVAIVCGSVAVVAGGAAAALFVLKKKKIF